MTDTPARTDAEMLAALETYVKTLTALSKDLRARVTADMGLQHLEKVGAYLPDGTKMASVARQPGNKSARVANEAAALKWCLARYPDEVQTVQVIRPAFLKVLLDTAKASGKPGDAGVDPHTSELLPFIEVVQGSPFVKVETTDEGVQRMEALAHGFAGMLEAPKYEAQPYDPDFADRLENGAYEPRTASYGAGPGEGR